MSDCMDTALNHHEMLQNHDKAVTLVKTMGEGAARAMKNMINGGHGVASDARYLGPMLNYMGRYGEE
eukprot:11469531-Karenia_brevis.AAC.1